MEVFTLATLAALVWKVVSVIKLATGKDYTPVITQCLTWVAGVIAVLLAAQTDVAETVRVFGEMSLGQLDGWSQVLVGLTLSSVGSVAYDYKKAFDNTDSASEPPLGGGSP